MIALQKKMSYLRARDPSLKPPWSKMRNNRNIVPQQLLPDESAMLEDSAIEESGKLDVYLRLKFTAHDDNLYQVSEDTLTCHIPEESQSGRNVRDGERLSRMYSFTKIFPSESSQIELFDNVVKRKILKCINGHTTNLLTYGPSGSGKTFTIVGTPEEPGMIPQSLEYLFRSVQNLKRLPVAKPKSGHMSLTWLRNDEQLNEVEELKRLLRDSDIAPMIETHYRAYTGMQKRLSKESAATLDELGSNVSVWISFAEIYNEFVYDLLATSGGGPRKKLKIYNNNGETYIKDLKQVYVRNGHDAYCILQYGLLNLNYAATALNSHSSRSHCIFTISLVQCSETESNNYLISRINFCDLAGSERSKKSKNVGSRLNESNNINNSLLVLGRCISAIRNSQKSGAKLVIPFRESKLTQLFHKALQGDEDISMIVAINPDRSVVDETLHALNFSAIAKQITLDKVAGFALTSQTFNSEFSVADYERQIDVLQEQVLNLTSELCEERQLKEENDAKLRHEMIERFKTMYADAKERARLNWERVVEEKDEIIEELQEELEKLRDADASVISISSSESSFSLAKQERRKEANRELMQQHSDLVAKFETLREENALLTKKLEQQAKRIESDRQTIERQNEMLMRQKLDIIKLQEDNTNLNADVEASIRHSNYILGEYESDASDPDEKHLTSI